MSTSAQFWLKPFRYLSLVVGLMFFSELHAQSPWTARNSGTTANLAGAVYASELGAASLVAVGAQGTILSSADDGVTWTRRDSGTSVDLTAVTYVSSIKRLFAVGEGGVILASVDGVVWAREASPTSVRLNAVSGFGDTVLAVGEAGAGLLTRDASGVWTRYDVGFSDRSMKGLSGGGVAVGQTGTIFSPSVGVSGAPSTWTMVPSPSGADLEAVGLGVSQNSGTTVTIVGAGGAILQKLSTGYAARVSGTTERFRSICFKLGGNIRVITGAASISVGEYFVVGTNGAILRSADGVTWQPDQSPTRSNLNAVITVRNSVIAFGDAGTILTTGASSGSILAITRQPTIGYDQTGSPYLEGAATGEGALTYLWVQLNAGRPMPVGNLPRIPFSGSLFSGIGPPAYQLFVANAFGVVQSETVTTNRFSNLSSRAVVGVGEKKLISGFAVASVLLTPRTVLIRAVGPTLNNFGLTNALKTPRLTVYSGQTVIASNTGWQTNADVAGIVNATKRLGAFSLSSNSADSVLLLSLAPGNYTAQVESADGTTGVALVEVYDVDPPSLARLSNLSARAEVQTGDGILIGGLVVEGGLRKKMLLRAAGPALAAFGVQGVLAKPKLTLFQGANVIATATDWSAAPNVADLRAAAKAVGAFAFTEGSADAALIVELAPGAYTLQAAGADGGTGVSLVEVYELP